MTNLIQIEDLQAAIRLAVIDSSASISSLQLAKTFYEENRELIAETVAEQWIIERLTALIAQRRSQVRRENDQQLTLELGIGFGHLPGRFRLAPNLIVPRAEATIGDFRKFVTQARRRETPAVAEALRAIDLMQRYVKKGGPKVTWGDVVRQEAEKAKNKGAAK